MVTHETKQLLITWMVWNPHLSSAKHNISSINMAHVTPSSLGRGLKKRLRKGLRPSSISEKPQPSLALKHPSHPTRAQQHLINSYFTVPAPTEGSKVGVAAGTVTADPSITAEASQVPH